MRVIAVALMLAAYATPARAQSIDALAPFMGCWRGAFDGGDNVRDERCFERNGAYMHDKHFVRTTDYSGDFMYYADVEAEALAYAYFASDGGRSSWRTLMRLTYERIPR